MRPPSASVLSLSKTSYSKSVSRFSMLLPKMNDLVPMVVKGIKPNARAVLISRATFLCALALIRVCKKLKI